jgi:hypothetical protein
MTREWAGLSDVSRREVISTAVVDAHDIHFSFGECMREPGYRRQATFGFLPSSRSSWKTGKQNARRAPYLPPS